MSSHCDLDLWPLRVIFISDISHGVIIHHSKYYGSIVIIHWNRGQNVIFSFTMSYHCPTPKMTKSKNLSGAIAPSFIDQSLSYFTVRCRMTYSTNNPIKFFEILIHLPYRAKFPKYGYIMSGNMITCSCFGVCIHIIITHYRCQYHVNQ